MSTDDTTPLPTLIDISAVAAISIRSKKDQYDLYLHMGLASLAISVVSLFFIYNIYYCHSYECLYGKLVIINNTYFCNITDNDDQYSSQDSIIDDSANDNYYVKAKWNCYLALYLVSGIHFIFYYIGIILINTAYYKYYYIYKDRNEYTQIGVTNLTANEYICLIFLCLLFLHIIGIAIIITSCILLSTLTCSAILLVLLYRFSIAFIYTLSDCISDSDIIDVDSINFDTVNIKSEYDKL